MLTIRGISTHVGIGRVELLLVLNPPLPSLLDGAPKVAKLRYKWLNSMLKSMVYGSYITILFLVVILVYTPHS